MKALRFSSNRLIFDPQADSPTVPPGEQRIRIRLAGICRTDLELTRGYMNYEGVLGHEFVGEIADTDSPWPKGTRVTGEINAGCGECEYCGKGLARHCPNRSTLGILKRDGCMAEWAVLPRENIYPIPPGVPDETAVFVEPLAASLEIFEQIHIQPEQRICVIGDGKLGLLIALVAAHKQDGNTLLIGHHQKNLDRVSDRLDVTLEKDFDASTRKQWDIVIDATGSSQGLNQAMTLARPRGTIVLKSTMAHAEALDLTPLVIDEITLVGSRCGQFPPALRLLERGVLPLERLIEAVYPLEEAEEAWKRASTPGALKVLLRVGGSE